jgi:protein tyrosine/serine phosphatase
MIQYVEGSHVSGNVWRSAQPKRLLEWLHFRDTLKVKRVVKLNFESESSSDDLAKSLGLEVHPVYIEIGTKVSLDSIERAVDIMSLGDTLVHCTHGQDRTGIVVAFYRVRHDAWTVRDAWVEAKENGMNEDLLDIDFHWFSENAAGRAP